MYAAIQELWRTAFRARDILLVWGVLWGGCASSPQLPPPTTSSPSVERVPVRKKPSGNMSISGTLGTIPPHRVQSTLERRLPAMQRCFLSEVQKVDSLFGSVSFSFVAAADGAVDSVFLGKSTIGNRSVELCLLRTAEQIRFPRPRGGDTAEFSWGFSLDAPEDLRAPVTIDERRVAAGFPELMSTLAACGAGQPSVTAYIEPGGAVVSVGLASSSALPPNAADCVVRHVMASELPDPGSYIGKVTFSVP